MVQHQIPVIQRARWISWAEKRTIDAQHRAKLPNAPWHNICIQISALIKHQRYPYQKGAVKTPQSVIHRLSKFRQLIQNLLIVIAKPEHFKNSNHCWCPGCMIISAVLFCQFRLKITRLLLFIIGIPFPRQLIFNYQMDRIRIFMTILLLAQQACLHKLERLELTRHKHLLVLYAPAEQPSAKPSRMNFKIDFGLTQLTIDKQYALTTLYFDSSLKYPINVQHVQPKKLTQNLNINEDDEIMHGIVGLAHGSQFVRALKESLKVAELKLRFSIYENFIQIIPEGCRNPLFAPYTLELSDEEHHQFLVIEKLSLNLAVGSKKLVSFLGKSSNPFTMSPTELHKKISIKLLNVIQTSPLHQILKNCRKISGSINSECEIDKSESKAGKDDYGLLLFSFDPILCPDSAAIELQEEDKIDSVGYYWTHLLLIVLEISLVLLFQYRHGIARKITCFIKNRKLR